MRKFMISSVLALLALGTVAFSSAEAQFRARSWYNGGFYYYPSYSSSYVVPQTYVIAPQSSPIVTAPSITTLTPGATIVTPTYSSSYYSSPGYYNRPYEPYYGGANWYGWRPTYYSRWR